jgi:hypothetical protein
MYSQQASFGNLNIPKHTQSMRHQPLVCLACPRQEFCAHCIESGFKP